MNNLKRVLSLALASVMLIGMMAVSASATSFSDDKDIENKEAVGTMVALNIIDGMGDGTYDPKGLLLREQAAKMVFVALNGGQKNDSLTTKEVGTFSDVKKGSWAEGYIEWCYNRGIIAGVGGGLFNPKGNLTGTQLSKIMLVAIGYDPKEEGLEGTSDWALNVNALALKKGFYKGLGAIDPEANITRDQAALLILNACNAPMVEYDYKIVGNNGSISTLAVAKDVSPKETILSESYNAVEKEAVLAAYEYDTDTETFTYHLSADDTFTMTTAGRDFDSKEDFTSLLGERVRVLYDNNDTGTQTDDKLYGFFSTSKVVTATTVGEYADLGLDDDDFTGTEVAAKIYETKRNETIANMTAAYNLTNVTANVAEPSTLKLVDADNDGLYDWAVITPVSVQKVTFVSSTGISAGSSYTYKKDTIYDGAAVGDFVTVVAKAYVYNGKNVIEKATVVDGTVDRTRRNSTTNADTDLQIDGSWYKKAATMVGDNDTILVGNEAKLVVVGSYYYSATKVVAEETDLLVVAAHTGGLSASTASVYFTDGKQAEVKVVKYTDATGTAYEGGNVEAQLKNGQLCTYSVDSNGNYTLSAVTDTAGKENLAGYKLFSAAVTGADILTSAKKEITVSGGTAFRLADDTIVLYYNTTKDTVKVFTGAAVKNWANDVTVASPGTGYVTNTQLLGSTINGFATAKVAVLMAAGDAPGTTGDASYGYVVSKAATLSKEGGKYYVNFQVWNGTAVVDVKEETTNSNENTKAGKYTQTKFVTYKDLGNGIVKDVTQLTYGTPVGTTPNILRFNEYAVTALEGKDIGLTYEINNDTDKLAVKAGHEKVYKLTSDTIVIGFNSTDKAGVEGAVINLAAEKSTGLYIKNAWALINAGADDVTNANDKVVVIFVDTAK